MEIFIQGVTAICLFGIVCAMFKQVELMQEQTKILENSFMLQNKQFSVYWSDCQQWKGYLRCKAKEQD